MIFNCGDTVEYRGKPYAYIGKRRSGLALLEVLHIKSDGNYVGGAIINASFSEIKIYIEKRRCIVSGYISLYDSDFSKGHLSGGVGLISKDKPVPQVVMPLLAIRHISLTVTEGEFDL